MANTFKNALSAGIGTGATIVYTAGSGVTATIIGCTVANISSAQITATVTITDTSGTVTSHIVKDAPIPVGRSLVAIGGDHKIVLETTDKITVTSSASSSIDAIVSVLEIT